MKKVSLLAVVALMVFSLAASVVNANPMDAAGGNQYYQASPQGQYGTQNASADCYWGGNNYQQGNGNPGWNNWNCW